MGSATTANGSDTPRTYRFPHIHKAACSLAAGSTEAGLQCREREEAPSRTGSGLPEPQPARRGSVTHGG
ncbi:hypothetical protein GCM10023403_27460 [Pseudonocardia benzenivorans]